MSIKNNLTTPNFWTVVYKTGICFKYEYKFNFGCCLLCITQVPSTGSFLMFISYLLVFSDKIMSCFPDSVSLYKLMKSERSVKKSVYFVRLISEVSSNEALVCFWKTRCRPLLMCGWILKVTRFPSLLFFLIQRSQFILLSQLLSFCSTARVLLTLMFFVSLSRCEDLK